MSAFGGGGGGTNGPNNCFFFFLFLLRFFFLLIGLSEIFFLGFFLGFRVVVVVKLVEASGGFGGSMPLIHTNLNVGGGPALLGLACEISLISLELS